jgi:hypothetical protein
VISSVLNVLGTLSQKKKKKEEKRKPSKRKKQKEKKENANRDRWKIAAVRFLSVSSR